MHEMSEQDLAERKKVVFGQLYALDQDSADEEDTGLLASLGTIRGRFIGDATLPEPVIKRRSVIAHSLSSPISAQHHTKPKAVNHRRTTALELLDEAEAVRDTPLRSLRKYNTVTGVESLDNLLAQTPSGMGMPRAAGKRKRDDDVVKETPLPGFNRSDRGPGTGIAGDCSHLPTSSLPERPVPLHNKSATVAGSAMERESRAPPSSAIPRAPGKRKRDADIRLVPEDQRVFSGCHFYFFPNDDVHAGRRLRIAKAMQYGATWQKDWNTSVTHVVVDVTMTWNHVTQYLSKNGGPTIADFPAHIIVVDQSYPAECINYRMLVDPKQKQYLIQGYALPASKFGANVLDANATVLPLSVVPSQVSRKSLQLKPSGKSVMARQPQTLTTAEDTPSGPSESADSNGKDDDDPDFGPNAGSDELDAAIREAKETEHLALESDNEEISEPVSSVVALTAQQSTTGNQQSPSAWQAKFQCMHKHTGDNTSGPNTHTISLLQEMADYYMQTRDEWRSRAYRSAIGALRNHPSFVATKAEAMRLNGVGESIAEKIEEIVVSNKLRKLDHAKLDPRQRILQTFLKIYGVGFVIADRWVTAGFRNLNDLIRKADLTTNQRIGIEHYDDFNARIPRSEVERHSSIVRATLRGLDPQYQVYTMGSYRRGAESSGDIDLLITKPGTSMSDIRAMVVETLVPTLTAANFFVAALAATSLDDGSKWHGACCLPGAHIWRRIDLLLVPDEQLGAALIYFTGNDIFNRSLRLLASRKGLRLNQRGLYKDVSKESGRERVTEGELVEGRDERKIFRALGVPWRPPQHRVC